MLFDKTKEVKDEFSYSGALVHDANPDLYEWCIPVDFSSLYPSIIR